MLWFDQLKILELLRLLNLYLQFIQIQNKLILVEDHSLKWINVILKYIFQILLILIIYVIS